MKRVLIWVLVLSAGFVLGRPSPSPAAQRRIAVLDFRNTSNHPELGWLSQALPETLVTKLAGVASIHVIERGRLAKVIKEQRLGLSDLLDPSKAAKVGRLAGAHVVVIGGYVVFGKNLMFNLRFVDTETAIVLHTAQVQSGISDGKTLFAGLNRLADAAVGSLGKKVVVRGGEKRVVKAAPIALTPKEKRRLTAPPAKSLMAYQLYGKGLAAYKKGRWREADALYARALERDPAFAGAAGWRATVLIGLGRYAEALDLNARALALYREKGDDKNVAAVLNNIGVIHKRQGRYDEALRRYEESLDIKRRLGNQAGIAATLGNIGSLYYQQGRYDEAMRKHKDSLDIERRLGNQAGTAASLNEIGVILQKQSRYDEALGRFEESLDIQRKLGNQAGIATTLGNIGSLYYQQGRYDDAMRRFEESLDIQRKLGNQAGIATTLNNIGTLQYRKGRYDDAMRRFEESLDIQRKLGNQARIAATLNNIGSILNDQGRYDEALRRYEESLDIERKLGNQAGIVTTLNNMAYIHFKRGKHREALRLLCRTLDIERRIGVPTKRTEGNIAAVKRRVPGAGC